MHEHSLRDTSNDLTIVKNFIPKDIVDFLKDIYYKYPWRRERAYVTTSDGTVTENPIRKGEFVRITQDEYKYAIIFFNMNKEIKRINDTRFKFDIDEICEDIKVISYCEGDYFEWHYDIQGESVSNRKLNFSIQLSDSDEYEGGDLEFFLYDLKSNENVRKAGTLICYPAYIPHRATKVTSGQRLVLVGHMNGNTFR